MERGVPTEHRRPAGAASEASLTLLVIDVKIASDIIILQSE
jgi:hypothetical protein